MEHLIVDPLLQWLVVTGVYIFHSDRSYLPASPDSTRDLARQVAKAITSERLDHSFIKNGIDV